MGACTWKTVLKYKVKQSKNSKFTSNYKASPIDFDTQISLQKEAPQKRPLKNISPRAYFWKVMVCYINMSDWSPKCCKSSIKRGGGGGGLIYLKHIGGWGQALHV